MPARIFVHIANYRDPECDPTLGDMFARAARPEDIRAVVVHQRGTEDPPLARRDRVQTLVINARETRGACWARWLGYRLWDGEEYALQLDSHMRFTDGWDTKLLAQLAACPSAKPILTTYPPAYDPPDQRFGSLPTFLAAHRFDERGYLEQRAMIYAPQEHPLPTALVSGNFLFGPSAWFREVPYDPFLYFHGEELTLAVRLWTAGWDLFGPSEPIVWHRYGREGRATHWGDNPDWWRLDEHSLDRVRYLLGMGPPKLKSVIDLDRYGLGTARTLQDYEAFSGINFLDRTISEDAQIGHFPSPG